MDEEDGKVLYRCMYCGLIDRITGCRHTRKKGQPPTPVSVGPGAVYLVESVKPVSVQINSTTGLPMTPRW
jgi:hypothetical protein